MITVRSTRAAGPEPVAANRYRIAEKKASRTPHLVGVLMMGLVFYLRDVFPNWASLGPDERDAPKGPGGEGEGATAPQGAGVAQALSVPVPAPEPQPPEETAPAGSGSLVFRDWRPYEPMRIEGPAIPFVTYEGGMDIRTALPDALLPRAVNDNGPGGGDTGGGDTGGGDTGGPGDHDDDDDDDDDDDGGSGDDDDDDDDDDDGEAPQNRAPVVSGPVRLYDVTGCAAVLIGLSDFLRNASDPDGDTLSIVGLTVSSGTIVAEGGSWLYDPAGLGEVVFTYTITDGALTVVQTAHLSVVRAAPILGTAGDDIIVGTDCADEIDGGDGHDNIDAGAGDDVIVGGAGNDHIVAGAGDDVVFGGAGDDVIFAGAGNDTVFGGSGNDRIFGEEGDDTLYGEAGNDLIMAGAGDDIAFGGEGCDTLHGEAGDDVLDGGAGDDVLDGGTGDDVLMGGEGCDHLDGGEGDDTLSGGTGQDVVLGGAGDDTVIGEADGADDVYDGGEGEDTLDYSEVCAPIHADLAAGLVSGEAIGTDTVSAFEIFIAGGGDDTILGSGAGETIHGGAGCDTILAGGGDDTVHDGAGADHVDLGAGDDTLVAAADGADDRYEGGAGSDTLSYAATKGGVVVDLKKKTATGVEIGTDTISGFETIVGGDGDDTFRTGTDPVRLKGGKGADTFDFTASLGHGMAGQLVHDILDLMAGDRIKLSRYDIFDDVVDTLEDRFEKIYGKDLDDDDMPIRIRHERTDDIRTTYIEADMDRDDVYELAIRIDGHHVLMIVENV